MSNKWEFLFEEGADLSKVRTRHSRMEKTAGVFMRPSDIAGHTELANALEGMLNGQPGGSTFKDHPGEQKLAAIRSSNVAGAVLGGVAGYYGVNKINPVPPPNDTKGFRNKVQKVRHEIYKFTEEHPKMTKAVGAVTGAVAGGFSTNADVVKRLRAFKRGIT